MSMDIFDHLLGEEYKDREKKNKIVPLQERNMWVRYNHGWRVR